jgi:hypothetical protein
MTVPLPAERPIDGHVGGVAEGILRVNHKALDVVKSLEKAATTLFRVYPEDTLYVNVTANVVLQKEDSYSMYYGQRFSLESKEVMFGQEFDSDGVRTLKAATYEVSGVGDVSRLPTSFSTEYFGELFKKNFGASNVKVHSVVNLIYRFSKGLQNFEEQKTTGQAWVRLF